MSIITLTTDLGHKDHYLASIKGKILSQISDIKIIDISHTVDKYNIVQGAFILKNCFEEFPLGTIHIIGIRPLMDNYSEHTIVLYRGHYFIGADNGIFSLIFDEFPEDIRSIQLQTPVESLSFPTKEIFVPSACHIARGGKIELLGPTKSNVREMVMIEPVVQHNLIRGSIQYVDSFGNLISNIRKELFEHICQNRKYAIHLRSSNFVIKKIAQNYNQVPEGEMVAIFGANGFLEVAIHSGPANSLLGLKFNDMITIEFYDN